MNQPESSKETQVDQVEVSSPEAGVPKREWAAPAVEEFDLTLTQGAVGVGADIGIYS